MQRKLTMYYSESSRIQEMIKLGRVYTKSVLVTEQAHDSIDTLKIANGEPYGSVINRLIEFYKEHKLKQ